ncbi:MFS transporter [Streptomyces massasporeus]|uniref:MFS transporter n=1 Tax=Streptomyces massasporeus TaxID=67324 RepID=UPI0033E462B1
MVTLDATVVNIALPEAQHDLGFSDGSRQWVITGYALAFGSLPPLGGRLGDLFGRRTTFVTGLIGFAAASVIGGAATTFDLLVAARVAQGLFAALLAPTALSLLSVTFTEPAERPKAFGIFSALSGAGAAVGLLLGGMLTEWASWRWVMYVNVIFAGVALVGALLFLAKPAVTERPKIDIPGTVVVSAALFGIVYGFAHVESTSWTDPVALGSMISGVVLLAVLAWLELRVAHPLLPLRVVLDRTRGGSFLAVFVLGMGMFSIFLFLTYYLEAGIGYSPIEAGLSFLPMVAGIVASSTRVPSLLLSKVGPKVVVSVSFLVSASGMALLTQLTLNSAYVADIMPGMILLGLGIGGVMTTAFQGATAGVHHEDAGVASALINTSQQVGEPAALEAGCTRLYLVVQIELKDPGHPASRVAHRVKESLTAFFRAEAEQGGASDPDLLARQLILVFDGASARAGIKADTQAGLTAPTVAALLDAADMR